MTVEELVRLLSRYPASATVWFVHNELPGEARYCNINAVGTELQVEDFLSVVAEPSGGLAVSEPESE